jgi:hypothetical protein
MAVGWFRSSADNRLANSISPLGGLRIAGPGNGEGQGKEFRLGRSAKIAAMLLLSVALSACAAAIDEGKPVTFTDDRGVSDQPFPKNFRAEVLAFMKTYLNNPVGVRDAVMAEPVQRVVGGRQRYLVCLRFSSRESDGGYREPRERAVLFVDGRLDRVIENAAEPCAGAAYALFADLEKMTR